MKFILEGAETERLKFGLVNEADFHQWLPFFQNPGTSMHWVKTRESPEDACKKWFHRQTFRYQNDLGGMNALIEKRSGSLIGYCGLLVQTVEEVTELEVGYSLLPSYWNQGYASEAATKCRDYAFEQKFSSSLISIISITNKPSERVAVKNGMRVSKTTVYKGNNVNIFRITSSQWGQLVHPTVNSMRNTF